MARNTRKPRSPVIPVQLGGQDWHVKYRKMPKNWGLADFGRKRITISPDTRQVNREREIAIHEALHVLFPQVDEEIILAAGKEIDDYLDALGL